ncbi:hypothetical protein BaRGS_00031751, partial [Batillaria attramentaria]
VDETMPRHETLETDPLVAYRQSNIDRTPVRKETLLLASFYLYSRHYIFSVESVCVAAAGTVLELLSLASVRLDTTAVESPKRRCAEVCCASFLAGTEEGSD